MNRIIDFFLYFTALIFGTGLLGSLIFMDISILSPANWDIPIRAVIFLVALGGSVILMIEQKDSPAKSLHSLFKTPKREAPPAKTIDELIEEANQFEQKIKRMKESMK